MGKKVLYYKVLRDGAACHGGEFTYSLPREENGEWIPGDWHVHEGDISLCRSGFHLTNKPILWYKKGFSVFLAEYDGSCTRDKSSDKIAARKVRLLRPILGEELSELGIIVNKQVIAIKELSYAFGNSFVKVTGTNKVVGYDTSRIEGWQKSRIDLFDESRANAYEQCCVDARDSSLVYAYNGSEITARHKASVRGGHNSRIYAFDETKVEAIHNVWVKATNTAHVVAENAAYVILYSTATAEVKDDVIVDVNRGARVEARGRAIVRARNSFHGEVILHDEAIFIDQRTGESEEEESRLQLSAGTGWKGKKLKVLK